VLYHWVLSPSRNATVTRPLLLVDVDGVLCPNFIGAPPPGFERLDIGAVDVWLSKQHGRWLNHLATWFDLVWATTWEQDAAEILAPALNLPLDMPVIEFTSGAANRTWKLTDIEEYVGDRPFAWIDDDIGPDAELWAKMRDAPTLFVRTEATIGMTQADVTLLEDFAESVRSLTSS
jgi:hypothetical protein